MKHVKILLLVLLTQQASAQYYQHTYGGALTNESNAQFVPSTGPGTGYVLAGNHIDPAVVGALQEVHVVHHNNNGAVPLLAPYFNNRYLISDPITGVAWNAVTTSITEIVNPLGAPDYAVAGIVIVNAALNDYDVFVMNITNAGVVNWIFRYDFPNFLFKDPKIQMDLTNTNILVTGRCVDQLAPANLQDVFVFNINAATGAFNWAETYDLQNAAGVSYDDVGTDIIDNPYTAGELLVVGSSSGDGLLLRINSLNGAPLGINPVQRYNFTPNGQSLNCIRVSNNPMVATGNAFVVSGSATVGIAPALHQDQWTMLIDEFGVITWSSNHDNGSGVALNNWNSEIMERLNTLGAYEYYAIGTINQGAAVANTDIQVLKLNAGGALVAFGEFLYGTALDIESGRSIRMSNTGGFAASGTTSIRAGEQLRVNAYFNGVTACNTFSRNFISIANIPAINVPNIVRNNMPRTQQATTNINGLPHLRICFALAIATGNNAKEVPIAQEEQKEFNFDILQNGTREAVSTGIVKINLRNHAGLILEARIVDILGREIPCSIEYGPANENTTELKLRSEQLQNGMYYIILSDGKSKSSKALLVK